ncbi:MAG TPA: type II toxin-antitoxin system Phd/YefM family antitoxin [Gammaproteobacteria bacterium]|nr:type II toxin-antitoxin system Phd/YefM family antitoxin [Gammaproteobacteria bacterium]
MKLSSQIKPISYLKAHASELIRKLSEQQEPLIITQNGEAKVVICWMHSERSPWIAK